MPKLAIAGPGGTIAPNTTPRGRVSPGNPNTSLIPRTGKVVGVAVTVEGAVDVFDGVDVGVGVSLNAKLAPVPQPASSARVRAIGRVRDIAGAVGHSGLVSGFEGRRRSADGKFAADLLTQAGKLEFTGARRALRRHRRSLQIGNDTTRAPWSRSTARGASGRQRRR